MFSSYDTNPFDPSFHSDWRTDTGFPIHFTPYQCSIEPTRIKIKEKLKKFGGMRFYVTGRITICLYISKTKGLTQSGSPFTEKILKIHKKQCSCFLCNLRFQLFFIIIFSPNSPIIPNQKETSKEAPFQQYPPYGSHAATILSINSQYIPLLPVWWLVNITIKSSSGTQKIYWPKCPWAKKAS